MSVLNRARSRLVCTSLDGDGELLLVVGEVARGWRQPMQASKARSVRLKSLMVCAGLTTNTAASGGPSPDDSGCLALVCHLERNVAAADVPDQFISRDLFLAQWSIAVPAWIERTAESRNFRASGRLESALNIRSSRRCPRCPASTAPSGASSEGKGGPCAARTSRTIITAKRKAHHLWRVFDGFSHVPSGLTRPGGFRSIAQ